MRYVSLTVFMWLSLIVSVNAETISLWNFNDAISGTSGGEMEFLVDYGTGQMTSDFSENNIKNTAGSSLNSLMGNPAGRALLLSSKANNGNSLTWMADTTGFADINISFAARRTGTGFDSNQFLYSSDSGLSWVLFGPPFKPESEFSICNLDFGGIDALDNNFQAGFRIVFDGATSYSGNNQIDNLVVSGTPVDLPPATPVPEPATAALLGFGLLGILLIRKKLRSFKIWQMISR